MKSELSSPENSTAAAPRTGGPAVIEPESSPARPLHAGNLPFKIPPILLEGDDSEPAPVTGDAEKFSLGPEAPGEALETEGELPDAYGTEKLLLTARDPHWLYAHWDFTHEQQQDHCAHAADGRLVLRVYRDEVSARPEAEVRVHPDARHWFVHLGHAGTQYVAELGYHKSTGDWTTVSTSAATTTPPEAMSPPAPPEFATIPFETPMAELLSLAAGYAAQHLPLAAALEKLRAQGHPDLPASQPFAPWTAEKENALAEIIGLGGERRVWMGSMEITELIQPRPDETPASPGGISSPFGGGQPQKNFWFNLNAEVIIYGATEPDATVTIGGRPIKLRPDGSFSYRFALPDGHYELPVVAVSADHTDARAAELQFSRATERRGVVGAHPQDPELKAPEPQNI